MFWLSAALVSYVYVGYPALLELWARLRPRPYTTAGPDTTAEPGIDRPAVSIVIAARDEADRIARRIDNLLQLDYPTLLRQIIVVLNGSTDDAIAKLRAYGSSVEIVSIREGGKARALNAGVARAKHEILVFTDARQLFAPDALLELTAPFNDPQIGGVTGELILDCEISDRRVAPRRTETHVVDDRDRRSTPDRRRTLRSTIAEGIGLYWRYEKHMRRRESAIASTLGATGAIYALRRSLWKPLPPDTILDDVLAPMRAVLDGYRVVFNERAQAFDRASPNADAEARRKTRTLAGNYQILWLDPRLLLPWRNPVWLQYVSHKVGRLFVPYALLALAATSTALTGRSVVYVAALGVQCVFYLLAGYGAWLDRRGWAGMENTPTTG